MKQDKKYLQVLCHPQYTGLYSVKGLCVPCYQHWKRCIKTGYRTERFARLTKIVEGHAQRKEEIILARTKIRLLHIAQQRKSTIGKKRIRYVILKRRYGITFEEYTKLVQKQKGKCKICGIVYKRELYVDHCHHTKKVRGLLCPACNNYAGFIDKGPVFLKRVQMYCKGENK